MANEGEQVEIMMDIEEGEIQNQEVVMENDAPILSTEEILNEITGLEWIENGLELNLGTLGVFGPLPEPIYVPSEPINPYPYVEPMPHYYPNPTSGEFLSASSNFSNEGSSQPNPYLAAYYPTYPPITPVVDPYLEATIINRTNMVQQSPDYVSRQEYVALVENYYKMKSQRDQALEMVEELKKVIKRFNYQTKQIMEEPKYPLVL